MQSGHNTLAFGIWTKQLVSRVYRTKTRSCHVIKKLFSKNDIVQYSHELGISIAN